MGHHGVLKKLWDKYQIITLSDLYEGGGGYFIFI